MPHAKKPSPLILSLLATTMLTQPEPAGAAPGDEMGPEFQVNSFTTDRQGRPAVAVDADGDFVVAWQSKGQDDPVDLASYGIFAQRFNAAGMPQGPEFQVNTFTTGDQSFPAVAMDADGDFVVAWQSDGQDGSYSGIFAQRFDAVGVAQGPELRVNSFTNRNQRFPGVAMDSDGDFVVAWTSYGQDGGSGGSLDSGIFAQRFDAAGVAQGPEFQVNTFTTSTQTGPAVAMDADGDFVVAWQSIGQDDPSDTFGYGVFVQRFDAAGAPQGSELSVNTFTTNDQRGLAVAMDADGDFVVAWNSSNQDGHGWGVFAQRFDAAGVAQGSEFQVNSFTTNHQVQPAVAMDTDGDFIAAWHSFGVLGQDGSYGGTFAQRYDATGVAQGPEFQVNTFITYNQMEPAVAMDADGDFVVAWAGGYAQDGDDYGIFAQRYDGVERVAGDFDGDSNEDLLWHNATTGAAVVWLMEGATKLASQSIGRPPVAWQVAGIGEFNGDSKADILWRNTTTGSMLVWQMDGFTRTATVGIGGAPPVWVIEKVEDSDGDGLSDIFWRNASTGATLVWRMRGYTRVAVGGTGAVPADWQVK